MTSYRLRATGYPLAASTLTFAARYGNLHSTHDVDLDAGMKIISKLKSRNANLESNRRRACEGSL